MIVTYYLYILYVHVFYLKRPDPVQAQASCLRPPHTVIRFYNYLSLTLYMYNWYGNKPEPEPECGLGLGAPIKVSN